MNWLQDNNSVIAETIFSAIRGLDKSASEESPQETFEAYRDETLVKRAAYVGSYFADPVAGNYPISTRLEAALSYGYAKYSEHGNEAYVNGIRKDAAEMGWQDSLDAVDALFAVEDDGISKSASDDTPEGFYALQFEGQNLYPAENLAELHKSAAQLEFDFQRIPTLLYISACRNLVKRAEELDVGSPESVFTDRILKYATDRLVSNKYFDILRRQRKPHYTDEAMDALNMALDKMASIGLDDMDEARAYAGKIEHMDRLVGIDYFARNSTISDPYSLIFSGPQLALIKKAAESMVRIETEGETTIHDIGLLKKASFNPEFESAKVVDILGDLMQESKSASVISLKIRDLDEGDKKRLRKLIG